MAHRLLVLGIFFLMLVWLGLFVVLPMLTGRKTPLTPLMESPPQSESRGTGS